MGFIEITFSTYKDDKYYENSESSPVCDEIGTVTITKSNTARNVAELQKSFKES